MSCGGRAARSARGVISAPFPISRNERVVANGVVARVKGGEGGRAEGKTRGKGREKKEAAKKPEGEKEREARGRKREKRERKEKERKKKERRETLVFPSALSGFLAF